VSWALTRGYRNVLLECDNDDYDHQILKPPRVAELIERVRRTVVGGRRPMR
jgi:hypothetical protein